MGTYYKPNWKRNKNNRRNEEPQAAGPFASFKGGRVHKYPRQFCQFNYKTGEFDLNGVKGRINRMGGIIEIHTGDYVLDQHFMGQDLRIVTVTLPQFMEG